MKTMFAILALALVSTAARADGFVCENQDEALVVKVYNHTHAAAGTRNAAVMVISDSSIQAGNKTIARFSDTNETLASSASVRYDAQVDLRYNDSGRGGELIAGTKLGQLATISLTVLGFDYDAGAEAGDEFDGSLRLVKRNGSVIRVKMDCARYLKN